MIVAIVLQGILAALFFFFGYSMTWSSRQGRAPILIDVVILAMPLVLVAVFGAIAWVQVRRGRRGAAPLVWAPFPLTILFIGAVGVI
jgi:hypothetical protein